MKGRRIINFIELWSIAGSGGLEIWVSSTSFEKKWFWQNHENPFWILAPFLSEAVEAILCYFFKNWLMKLRFPNLRNIHYTDTFKQNLTCIFLSVRVNLKETFQCETPCSTMTPGDVGVWLPWRCHALVLPALGKSELFLNLIIFS